MTRRQGRVFAELKLPTKVPDLIIHVKAIVVACTGNPLLPGVGVVLAPVKAALADLEAAEAATQTRALVAIPQRDAKLKPLRAALTKLRAFIQELADADVENAARLIESAHLFVRNASTRSKAQFTAKCGPVSGSVILDARAAAKRATYVWEWRVKGSEAWNRAPVTLGARTELRGLPTGVYIEFRYAAVTGAGSGDFSDPIELLVK